MPSLRRSMGSNVQLNRLYELFLRMSRTIRSLIQLTKLTDFLETGSSEVENFRVGFGKRERETETERERERERER